MATETTISKPTLTPSKSEKTRSEKIEPRREPALWEPVLEGMSPYGLPFGRLFDAFWNRPFRSEVGRLLAPEMDVVEDDDAFTVTAELPGMKKEDVKIEFENGVLTVRGEKKAESEKKGRNYHIVERRYGAFHRAMSLPNTVNVEKATAEFEDGVLKVVLPKSEAAKPKELKIR